MADADSMHVKDSAQGLHHEMCCLLLREMSGIDNTVKELAAQTQLQDEVDVLMVLKGLIQLDYVWMVHHFHDLDFPLKLLSIFHVSLGDGLASSHIACGLALCFAYCAVGALT